VFGNLARPVQFALHPRRIVWRTTKRRRTMTAFTIRQAADFAAAAFVSIIATCMIFATLAVPTLSVV
jgi:hypothetical protein